MLSNSNIHDILTAAKGADDSIDEKDLLFLVLLDNYNDRADAYYYAYKSRAIETNEEIDDYLSTKRMRALIEAARPFGVGGKDSSAISREENQSELINMLDEIKDAISNGEMDRGQGLKLMADIRVKLQDKFDMDEDKDEEKHIIVVPQKHDYICPHTNRECSKMPSKEACMQYYNLTDSEGRTASAYVQKPQPKPKGRKYVEDIILDVNKERDIIDE